MPSTRTPLLYNPLEEPWLRIVEASVELPFGIGTVVIIVIIAIYLLNSVKILAEY